MKIAAIDDEGNLAYSSYEPVGGDALATATGELISFYSALPHEYGTEKTRAWVAHATVTGYGEELLRCALGVDSGVVETTAHARAAMELVPDATFVLDIGGQDMKALWIKNGMVSSAILNEACSSGCGSFIEGTAHSLHCSPYAFTSAALEAKSPVDLGTKCTVFMSSRVKHAQKIGASVSDLSAGIAYSVVKNTLFRIIGAERIGSLGNKIVVQGGAFKSDAVLRAFEKTCGAEVTRPDSAHLMGAIGAALIARERAGDATGGEREDRGLAASWRAESGRAAGREQAVGGRAADEPRSALLPRSELETLTVARFAARCPGCANACVLAVADFGNGRRLISGNKCGRANAYKFSRNAEPKRREKGDAKKAKHARRGVALNAIFAEQRLLAAFGDAHTDGARGERPVGLMNCFETYEYIPFWHTLFSSLGFSVVVPNDARGEAFEREALATVPAESACFPAKMAHMRLFDLIEAGAQTIFMPVLERGGRCAVSCEYACALKGTVPAVARGEVAFSSPRLSSFKASHIIASDDDRAALFSALAAMRPDDSPLTEGEFEQTLQAGIAAQEKFFQDVERANAAVMDWLAEDSRRHAIVVAGRPYHTDPRLMRGVDVMLAKLGFALLCPTSLEAWAKRIPHDPNCPPWKPGKHLARLARFAAANPQVDLVCLQSFGCSYDALSLEDARDILDAAGKPFTALKVDDLSDKAHIGIRLRTLAEGIETASRRRGVAEVSERRSGEGAPDATRDGKDSSLRGDFERTLGANSVGEGRPTRSEGASACETRACDGQMSITDFMGSGISTEDATVALREVPSDVCFTAAALMARALRVMDENPQVKEMHIPLVCNRCLLDGLGHTLWRLRGRVRAALSRHAGHRHRLRPRIFGAEQRKPHPPSS
mgnify:FL=1